MFLYRWKGFIKSLHLSRDPQKNRKSRSALKMHWAPCHYLSIGIQVPSQNVIGPDNGAFITSLPAHRTVCGSIGYMKKTSPPIGMWIPLVPLSVFGDPHQSGPVGGSSSRLVPPGGSSPRRHGARSRATASRRASPARGTGAGRKWTWPNLVVGPPGR